MDNLFPTQYPVDFESFWSVYPCKRGKAEALKAFKTARLKISLADMLAAAGGYRAFLMSNPKREPLHASTWLNQERWDDEYGQPGCDDFEMRAHKRSQIGISKYQ